MRICQSLGLHQSRGSTWVEQGGNLGCEVKTVTFCWRAWQHANQARTKVNVLANLKNNRDRHPRSA